MKKFFKTLKIVLPVLVLYFIFRINLILGLALLVAAIFILAIVYRYLIYYVKASKLYNSGNLDEAIKYFKKTYEVRNCSDNLRISYGFILLKSERLQEAEEVLNKLMKKKMDTNDKYNVKMNYALVKIENRNKLVGVDGCIGGKTGYTSPAGRCLLAIYNRNGRIIIGVVMKSLYNADDSAVFSDMKKIIDWSYAAEKTTAISKNTIVAKKTLKYKPLKFFGPTKTAQVPIAIKQDVNYYDNYINKKELTKKVNISNLNVWDLSQNSKVGTLSVGQREYKTNYALYPTTSTKEILSKDKPLMIGISLGAGAVAVIAVVLIALIIRAITRRGRKKRNKYY